MFDFCPHCGQTIGQEEMQGRMLCCIHCGNDIGLVVEHERATVDERTSAGTAARCSVCQRLVELKTATKTLVPHYAAGQKKICAGSGKAV